MAAYDECVEQIDRSCQQFQRGIILPGEFQLKLGEAIGEYIGDDDPRDDLDLLVAYAQSMLEPIASDPVGGDRAVFDVFDRLVRRLLHGPTSEATLSELLESIERRHRDGDPDAISDLGALCRSGRVDHPRLFMFAECACAVLHRSYALGAVDALVDAVHPRSAKSGQLGTPGAFGGVTRALSLDLLASLATNDTASGAAAVDALVELAGFLDVAGAALVRLPVHRLSMAHRGRLSGYLVGYEDLLVRDPILVPVTGMERLPDVVRSILWLANDAARFR